MQRPPPLSAEHALFLDFDGTLAELAPQPDAVQIPPDLPELLAALQRQLQGAVALLTGRPIDTLDAWLHPLQMPMAAEHGACCRLPGQAAHTPPTPGLEAADEAARTLVGLYPALRLERKRTSLALHYRQAPELQDLCTETLQAAVAGQPGLELLRGKCVVEAKPRGRSKGLALREFMEHAPFAGRTPVFAGDDLTDENAFAAAQALGGFGIKVGPGPSLAQYRCPGVAALRAWLAGPVPVAQAMPWI